MKKKCNENLYQMKISRYIVVDAPSDYPGPGLTGTVAPDCPLASLLADYQVPVSYTIGYTTMKVVSQLLRGKNCQGFIQELFSLEGGGGLYGRVC